MNEGDYIPSTNRKRKSASVQVESQRDIIFLTIALCFSAADGVMLRGEVVAVEEFFQRRLQNESALRRRERTELINEHFPRLLDQIRTAYRSRAISHLVRDSCEKLHEFAESQFDAMKAIELCLQVALADDSLNIHEGELLSVARQALGVTSEHVEHLCQILNFDDDVAIPINLTFREAIAFLNSEYCRWRAKRSHDEFLMQGNAAGRLRSIVRARMKIEESHQRKQRRVFVSHATADRDFVESTLTSLLNDGGMEAWVSSEVIKGGDKWEESIKDGLKQSGWFLVVLSPEAVQSKWVKTEVLWALAERPENIVPIMIEECKPSEVNLRLLELQHIDFTRDVDRARAQLIETWRRK